MLTLCKHSLRKMDIEAMKELVKVVNVIPVIAKSDSMTLEEREYFRKQVIRCHVNENSCAPDNRC